jgi:hypothetical protein
VEEGGILVLDKRLKDGMVIWKGRSPHSHKLVILIVQINRGNHAICPHDFIPIAKMLGLDVRPHWTEKVAAEGIKAIWDHVNIDVYDEQHEWKAEHIEVEPFVMEMAGKELNNQNMLHRLRR